MMTTNTPMISGAHRSVLIHECLQAGIVFTVIAAATILAVVKPAVVSSDLLSFVYGGAISYAGGRAASARQALMRRGDKDYPNGNDANG